MTQVEEARRSAMAVAFGWTFEIHDLMVYVILRPQQRRERAYLLRVIFEDFPARAPSYVFVDSDTKQITPGAWPPNVKHGSDAICTPGTREFHENLHRNDAQYPWDSNKYTFLKTLREIQKIMDKGIGG